MHCENHATGAGLILVTNVPQTTAAGIIGTVPVAAPPAPSTRIIDGMTLPLNKRARVVISRKQKETEPA